MKYCNYNFMLNEASSNNDIMCVANIVLNEAPTSNDAIRVGNNVCLTAMGTQQFSVVAIWPSCRKTDLPETRDKDTLMQTEISFALGKNGGYIPSSLGGRSISVGRQACRLAGSKMKVLVIRQLQFSEF